MKLAASLAAVAVGAVSAAAVSAETVDATDPAALVAVIQGLGYRATLDVDNVGDPMIRSRAGGTDFAIYFYGCSGGKDCQSLLFKSGYDLDDGTTFEAVNAWNEKTLFGRAYLDDEADPWLEMSISLTGGVSRANFEDHYDWWEVILEDFEEHIDF